MRDARRRLLVAVLLSLASICFALVWLRPRPPTVRTHAHQVKEGMTRDEVFAIWGNPNEVHESDGTERYVWYAWDGYLYVFCRHGSVEWQCPEDRSKDAWSWNWMRIRARFGF